MRKGVKPAKIEERPQKVPRLDLSLLDFECGARATEVVSSACSHFLVIETHRDSFPFAKIESRNQAPMCEHCWLGSFERKTCGGGRDREDPLKQQRNKPNVLIMVCLECKRCLCAGVGVAITDSKPGGHAWIHAHKKGHWVALWFDRPYEAYCFKCDSVVFLNQSGGETEVLQSAVDDEPGSRASYPETDELGYVIRGIPNCGNTCYVNALVQCLLALDRVRMWMLGPNAPMGPLGVALKELFMETTPGSDAGAMLNPQKLLKSLGALNARYAGATMEDSQELLLDMHKGLSQEDKLQWPPKIRDRFPTVVDSIFQGQMSSILTCKRCQFDSLSHIPFSELSLTLPSIGQTTKSVDSPRSSLAIEEGNLKKVPTDAMDKDKASEPLKTDCKKAGKVWQRDENDMLLLTQEDKISFSELLLEVIDETQKSARVGDIFSQQEFLVEAKEQVTPEDNGKALSRNFIYGDGKDSNSLGSIEHCLALYFKAEEVEWRCASCAKVSEEAGTGSLVKESFSSSTTNEESDCDGKAEKRIDMSIVQDSQDVSSPPNRSMQIDLNIAYQASEEQNEQKDRKGDADNALVISKVPPVLTVHLKRFDRVNDEQVKVQGHVSFGETLDVGQFLDPSSEDKDHSSYRLVGVIEHIGNSLDTGHVVAYVKGSRVGTKKQLSSGSSSWFYADEHDIKEISLEAVLKSEAYVLFYERMEG